MSEVATAAADPATPTGEWQALPARARTLFALGRALPLTLPSLLAGGTLGLWLEMPLLVGAITGAVIAFGLGLWLGLRQFRHLAWRLDGDGLAIRRGKLWQRETRVPLTRVQHLDVKRGPWQRKRHLATLIIHTAGTRHSAVTLPHLDAGDAERLRDVLGRQIDREDD